MPEKPPPKNENDDWKAAEKALEEALKGPQRIEALKRAGQLRYDAHKKLREKEATLKVELRRLSNDRGAENEAAVDGGTEDGEETRPPRR